jgi:hypothetical protein
MSDLSSPEIVEQDAAATQSRTRTEAGSFVAVDVQALSAGVGAKK